MMDYMHEEYADCKVRNLNADGFSPSDPNASKQNKTSGKPKKDNGNITRPHPREHSTHPNLCDRNAIANIIPNERQPPKRTT